MDSFLDKLDTNNIFSKRIGCLTCDSNFCAGCNMMILYDALNKGCFQWAMNEYHTIDIERLEKLQILFNSINGTKTLLDYNLI